MGVIKDRHGTYYVQKKVPDRLQEAVARVLDADEPRRVFLKKSLGTKSLKEAKAGAPHVLADFNRIFGKAEALLKEQPVVTTLTDAQIKRMAESFYASVLAKDEEERREGTGLEQLFKNIVKREAAGTKHDTPSITLRMPAPPTPQRPAAGLSDYEVVMRAAWLDGKLGGTANAEAANIETSGWGSIEFTVPTTPELLAALGKTEATPTRTLREALARGDYTVIQDQMDKQLERFQLNVDRKSPSYRKLGTAMLSAYVQALNVIERRNAGEPIETPQLAYALPGAPVIPEGGGTLREALEGWKNERERPEDGVHEYTRAVEMFIELHGNLAIGNIKRSHASQFRDALRQVPKTRKGPLLKAGLLELRQWGQEHPSAPKVSAATVNKQLGAVQAIISFAFRHGLVPDDVPRSDPFQDMRVEGEQSTRDAFDPRGLQTIFDAQLFTHQEIPDGGKGHAAVWLPLLAVFMGGRQGEFASLRVTDIREDAATNIQLLWITRDAAVGKRVKTDAGERVVPLHPQIIQLGFLDYVAQRKAEDGDKAWLFPAVAPDQRGGRKAWAKWWGRYLRTHIGIADSSLVYHSFRHGFQDALRRATPDEELRDALAGRSAGGKSVSRDYGAKQMLKRWGVQKLHETICNVSFPGLDLSRVQVMPPSSAHSQL